MTQERQPNNGQDLPSAPAEGGTLVTETHQVEVIETLATVRQETGGDAGPVSPSSTPHPESGGPTETIVPEETFVTVEDFDRGINEEANLRRRAVRELRRLIQDPTRAAEAARDEIVKIAEGVRADADAVEKSKTAVEELVAERVPGEPGPQGPQGNPGDKGEKGDTGDTGAIGATGLDGKSAYQIALDLGFTGTEQEWLASLKGADGTQGTKGEAGAQGPKGEKAKKAWVPGAAIAAALGTIAIIIALNAGDGKTDQAIAAPTPSSAAGESAPNPTAEPTKISIVAPKPTEVVKAPNLGVKYDPSTEKCDVVDRGAGKAVDISNAPIERISYQETGVGVTKTISTILNPGQTAIIQGWKVDGKGDGVFKAVTATEDTLEFSVNISDGAVEVYSSQDAYLAFCRAVETAVDKGYAHERVEIPKTWKITQ